MSKLIKRKDGSYSKRGLWDNIKANKASDKEPSEKMLKQASKIKKEENMKSMYKAGGKPSKKPMKSSFMEESKEITFDAPGVKPPMKKMMGGGMETGMEVNARMNQAEGEANMAGKKKMMGGKYKKGGFPDLNKDGEVTKADILKGRGVYKKGGAKTMEPGGGGRFAKMVSGLKKEGKSEDSAKAIAASVGRKKYGKSKFQEMAAAGKKKMMGGKKC